MIPNMPFDFPRLSKELEDWRKTVLNILIAFLPLQSMTGSTSPVVTTLTLILYTISLHIAAAAGASHLGVIFVILHIIPVVGIFIAASMLLTLVVKSATVVIAIILWCFFPIMITILYYFYTIVACPVGVSVPPTT